MMTLASRVIRKRYRKALAGGRHAGEGAPGATLHELRKSGKKFTERFASRETRERFERLFGNG